MGWSTNDMFVLCLEVEYFYSVIGVASLNHDVPIVSE
jgi:hypothetical protein